MGEDYRESIPVLVTNYLKFDVILYKAILEMPYVEEYALVLKYKDKNFIRKRIQTKASSSRINNRFLYWMYRFVKEYNSTKWYIRFFLWFKRERNDSGNVIFKTFRNKTYILEVYGHIDLKQEFGDNIG